MGKGNGEMKGGGGGSSKTREDGIYARRYSWVAVWDCSVNLNFFFASGIIAFWVGIGRKTPFSG